MRRHLNRETRLEISLKRLKTSVLNLRLKVSDLTKKLKEKDLRIADLEAKLENKEGQRKELLSYLYKPNKKDSLDRKPRGKKPGTHGFYRPKPKPEEVTERRTYTLTACPGCKRSIGDVVDSVTKYEEDITLVPRKTVKEITITRHWCPHCETYVKSPDVPPISRIGLKTLGYILYARYRLRLPLDKIRESLSDLHGLKISEGEIVAKLHEAETMFGKDYEAIKELIRQAKVVYSDETGWRMDGQNWWLWAFVTERGIQYILEDTRGKGVAEKALGDKMDRIIVSDGYAAYKNLPGDKQQCWVHLLRSAKINSPPLYHELAVLYHKLLLELEKPPDTRNKKYFQDYLNALTRKKHKEPGTAKVKARIIRDRDPLLTCLDYEGVLPENNTAERAIRPQVVMRKIFGGSRSLDGAKAHEVNTSVIETMRKQNPDKNFFEIMLPLLEKRAEERQKGHSGL